MFLLNQPLSRFDRKRKFGESSEIEVIIACPAEELLLSDKEIVKNLERRITSEEKLSSIMYKQVGKDEEFILMKVRVVFQEKNEDKELFNIKRYVEANNFENVPFENMSDIFEEEFSCLNQLTPLTVYEKENGILFAVSLEPGT